MKLKDLLSSIKTKMLLIFGKNKKLAIIVFSIVVLVCVCVIVFPSNGGKGEEISESEKSLVVSTSGYKEGLEDKLKKMLLSIEDVEFASVMVVCDESEKYVYLKNTTQTSSGSGESESKTITEEVVYEKNGSNTSPIIVSKIMPKVVGVWVVINSVPPSTKLDITNSICSVLNIDKSCISILQER